MSRTFAWELLGKASSLRAMETAWGCAALEAEEPSLGDCIRPGPRWPRRNVLLGNRQGVGAPSPPPPCPKRAQAGRVPSASGPRILGRSPAPIRGTLTLNLHMPTGSPRLLGAIWWLLDRFEAGTAEVSRPAPPPASGTQDRFGGGELQAHRAPEVKPFGPPFVYSSVFSYPLGWVPHTSVRRDAVCPRVRWGLAGLTGRRAAKEQGPREVDQPWQRAKVPSLRAEVLGNSEDFDLGKAGTCWYKVLSWRFSSPFLYFKEKRLILTTLWRLAGLSVKKHWRERLKPPPHPTPKTSSFFGARMRPSGQVARLVAKGSPGFQVTFKGRGVV